MNKHRRASVVGKCLPGYKGGQKGVDSTWAIRKSVLEQHRVVALVLSFDSLVRQTPEGISGREMSRNTERNSWGPWGQVSPQGA